MADLERRPRALLETLGYPAHWLRLLQKLRDPWLLDGDWLTQFMSQIRDPALATIYRHLKQVTADVILLGDSCREFVTKRPSLLITAAAYPIYDDISAIRSALDLLDRRANSFHNQTYSPEWLRKYRSRLEIELIDQGIDPDVVYPRHTKNPPKGWRQIRSLIELRELGHLMDNCVMMYHPQLSAGMAQLYTNHNSKEEPCCCLIFTADQSSHIHEIGFPHNRSFSYTERKRVVIQFIDAGLVSAQGQI